MFKFWFYFIEKSYACAVCATPDNPVVVNTYREVTLLLSFLPLTIFIGAFLFYKYKVKQAKPQ